MTTLGDVMLENPFTSDLIWEADAFSYFDDEDWESSDSDSLPNSDWSWWKYFLFGRGD